jgi:hypothetical protein
LGEGFFDGCRGCQRSRSTWDFWTVTGTAGAAVALLVDFFLKPHLQVRNEKFSQRAKDRLELVRVARAIRIESRKGIPLRMLSEVPEAAMETMLALLEQHNSERLDRLHVLSDDAACALYRP